MGVKNMLFDNDVVFDYIDTDNNVLTVSWNLDNDEVEITTVEFLDDVLVNGKPISILTESDVRATEPIQIQLIVLLKKVYQKNKLFLQAILVVVG